ncbi:hypothetical protein ACFLSG_01250 [Candidatus Bipolaricaulota bacterium]
MPIAAWLLALILCTLGAANMKGSVFAEVTGTFNNVREERFSEPVILSHAGPIHAGVKACRYASASKSSVCSLEE